MSSREEMSRRQKGKLKEGSIDYTTERLNENSINIDLKSTEEILHVINDEDKKVAYVVEKEIPNIAKAVDIMADVIGNGGRVFYVGPGTDGRLGVVDAAECPPTFGIGPGVVEAIMAGGQEAVFKAREWVEDEGNTGAADLAGKNPASKDLIVGISADGRSDYVLDAVRQARAIGSRVIVLVNNPGTELAGLADVAIEPVVGPEVLLGSTRMKVGISQKMVLTMLSTASMIKLGKTYSNLMVNIKSTNNKLIERAKKLVMIATGADYETAEKTLAKADKDVKVSILMLKKGVNSREAVKALQKCGGVVRKALEIL